MEEMPFCVFDCLDCVKLRLDVACGHCLNGGHTSDHRVDASSPRVRSSRFVR